MGSPIDAPAVQQFRSQFEQCDERQSSSEVAWLFDRDGIELVFRVSNQNRLECISLYGAGAESRVRKYKSALPAGLKFRMFCEDVESVLQPKIHQDRWATDFYVLDELVVRTAYDYDGKLNQFSLWLPEAAAELGARVRSTQSASAPDLSDGYLQLVAVLGKSETDSALLHFRKQFDECLERTDSGALLWCFLESSGRGSGFHLTFDRMRFEDPEDTARQLVMIAINKPGQQPAQSQLLESLPESLRFDQSQAAIRSSLGHPIMESGPDDFFLIDGQPISVSFAPRTQMPETICIYHPELAEQIGVPLG